MLVFYSNACALHDPEFEILSGKPVPYLESPDRMKRIMSHLQQNEQTKDWRWVDVDSNGTSSSTPSINLSEAISNVHDPDYIEYLQNAYESWVGDGGSKAAVIPEVFPHPGLLSTASQNAIKNKNISPPAKAGLYCFDLSCPITADTFGSAMAAVRLVLEASWHLMEAEEYRIQPAETAETDRTRPGVFALTRPPGHHAASAVCGGYCFFNNAAIAATFLQSKSASKGENEKCKVAILDIDYHHGNGTQEVFYKDPSVLYVSLHAEGDYPYFTGTTKEHGDGPGVGFNFNFPLPQHVTGDEEYIATLKQAITGISEFSPKWLIVSLGVDTYKDDPICNFRLTSECYIDIGREIGGLGLPTLFAMEGGYHLDTLGINVGSVLSGYEHAKLK